MALFRYETSRVRVSYALGQLWNRCLEKDCSFLPLNSMPCSSKLDTIPPSSLLPHPSFTSYPAPPSSPKYSCPLSSSPSPSSSGLPPGESQSLIPEAERTYKTAYRAWEKRPGVKWFLGPNSAAHHNLTLSPVCLFRSFYCRKSSSGHHVFRCPIPGIPEQSSTIPLAKGHLETAVGMGGA